MTRNLDESGGSQHPILERELSLGKMLNWMVAALAALVMLFGSSWIISMSSRLDTLQRAVEDIARQQADINRNREARLATLEATLVPMRGALERIELKLDDHLRMQVEGRNGR